MVPSDTKIRMMLKMTVFCRFDNEKESKSFKNVNFCIVVKQEQRICEDEYYEVLSVLLNNAGKYQVVNDVLDMEVM